MLNLLFIISLFSTGILAVYQNGKSLLTHKSCSSRDQQIPKYTNLIPEFKVKDSQTCSNLCHYIDRFHAFNNNFRCKKAHWNEKTHHCHLQRRNRQKRNERKEISVFQTRKIKFYLSSCQNEPIDIVGILLSSSEHASKKLCQKICHEVESCRAFNLVTIHRTGEYLCELLEDWNRSQPSCQCPSGQECHFEYFHKVQSKSEEITESHNKGTIHIHLPDFFYNSFNWFANKFILWKYDGLMVI